MLTALWSRASNRSMLVPTAVNDSGIIIGATSELEVLDLNNGEIISKLACCSHKCTCLTVASNSKRIAGGYSSGTVVVWKCNGEGLVKFTLGSSVHCLAFNPVSHKLAACSNCIIGLWSPEVRSVDKTKLSSAIACVSWTDDGSGIVVGHIDGTVALLDNNGNKKWSREFPSSCVTCLAVRQDILVVGHWLLGEQTRGALRILKSDSGDGSIDSVELSKSQPTCIQFLSDSLLLVGATSGRLSLVSVQHGEIATLYETAGWITWVSKLNDRLFLSTSRGTMEAFRWTNTTVHSIDRETYVVRDPVHLNQCTITPIHNIGSHAAKSLNVKGIVHKASVYRDKLALEVNDSVELYSLDSLSKFGSFKPRTSPSLILLAGAGCLVCRGDRRIELISFEGTILREWTMSSSLRYMRVIDGITGRESVLIGLADGTILRLQQEAEPLIVLKHPAGVRSVDMNVAKSFLAVIDETLNLVVYDIKERPCKVLLTIHKVSSFSFNPICSALGVFARPDGSMLLVVLPDGRQVPHDLRGQVLGFRDNTILTISEDSSIERSTVSIPMTHLVSHDISLVRALRVLSATRDVKAIYQLGLTAYSNGILNVARCAAEIGHNHKLLQWIAFSVNPVNHRKIPKDDPCL